MLALLARAAARAQGSAGAAARSGPPAGPSHDTGTDSDADLGPDADADVEARGLREQVALALDDLEARGLLSESRAAQSLVHAKAPRYGVRRLKQMLKARALDAGAADAALQGLRATEFERAHAVWLRRFGCRASDLRERARQQRFLAARGFAHDVIERVLKGEAPHTGTD